MKTLATAGILLLGILVGVGLKTKVTFTTNTPKFQVGSCVRELGHKTIEKITVSTIDSIETVEVTGIEPYLLQVYNASPTRLITVECPN